MPSSHRSQLLWSYISTVSNSILQVIAAVTITRFILPSEYGLVALALLCCRFPNYLSQLGMSRAVIQKPNLSEGNVRAAFTLSMGLGFVGCLAIIGMAPLLARFFHEPRLKVVLLVLSLNFIFQGAVLVSSGLLRRGLKMRQLAIADMLSYAISTFAIGLPIAIKGYGAWAIVASTVTQTMFAGIFYFAANPHSLRPTLQRSDFEHIVGFGGKATASSIIEGLGGSMDILMLGRVSTTFNVGIYNRSNLLIQLPIQNISNGLTQVLFTRFSRASAMGSVDAFDLFARFQRIFLAVIFPLSAGAAGAASCIVVTLYGSKWNSAIPVFAVLCAAAAADASHHLPGIQMEACGRFRHKLIIQFLYLICISAGIFLSAPHGLVVVGITITGLTLIRSLGLHFYASKYLNHGLYALLLSWVPGLSAALPVGGGIAFVARVLLKHSEIPIVIQFVVCVLTGLGICSAFYRMFYCSSIFDPIMALIGMTRPKARVSDDCRQLM